MATSRNLVARLPPLERPISPSPQSRAHLPAQRPLGRPAPGGRGYLHTWTADNLLRHPSFLGLREDKAVKDVKLERRKPKA